VGAVGFTRCRPVAAVIKGTGNSSSLVVLASTPILNFRASREEEWTRLTEKLDVPPFIGLPKRVAFEW